MKKLNITKKQFGESKYFTDKYGKLEYVSESGQFYKTTKGEVLKFKESKDMVNEDAVDDDLKLLDQYCSGIRGNLNDSTDPDGLSIKNRIANFIGWKDSKSKGKFVKKSDNDEMNESSDELDNDPAYTCPYCGGHNCEFEDAHPGETDGFFDGSPFYGTWVCLDCDKEYEVDFEMKVVGTKKL